MHIVIGIIGCGIIPCVIMQVVQGWDLLEIFWKHHRNTFFMHISYLRRACGNTPDKTTIRPGFCYVRHSSFVLCGDQYRPQYADTL